MAANVLIARHVLFLPFCGRLGGLAPTVNGGEKRSKLNTFDNQMFVAVLRKAVRQPGVRP